jgi:hypothetical protein
MADVDIEDRERVASRIACESALRLENYLFF